MIGSHLEILQETEGIDAWEPLPLAGPGRARALALAGMPEVSSSNDENRETKPGSCFRFRKRRSCVSGGIAR